MYIDIFEFIWICFDMYVVPIIIWKFWQKFERKEYYQYNIFIHVRLI